MERSSKRLVKVGERQIAIFKVGNEYFACNNRCPHEGYPLSEGEVSNACVLTCNWHNWKFDLRSGETIVGGDKLRRYPTRLKNGRIEIDVSEPSPEDVISGCLKDLISCFDDHEYDRMARELARIRKSGGDPRLALISVVKHVYDRFEFGMTHAVAAGADWLRLYHANYDDSTKQVAYLAEIIGHLAWDSRRQPVYPFPEEVREFDPDAFAAAIENEDEISAIAQIRGAIESGFTFKELFKPLCTAALAHYQDFGHSLIYVVKAREFVDLVGDEVLQPVLLMLVRSLLYAAREDLIPEFKDYAKTLSHFADDKSDLNRDMIKYGGVSQVLSAIAAADMTPMELHNALLGAASWQMLHMDISYSLKTSGPVQDNVGWLDFTHTLTFASAVRIACTELPDLWPQGLMQIGCFLGRNSKYVAAEEDHSRWYVDDPAGFVRTIRDRTIDHSEFEYIVIAHVVKLSTAISDEVSATPKGEWQSIAAAALNRFTNSPLRRKNPLRTASQAIDIVSREG